MVLWCCSIVASYYPKRGGASNGDTNWGAFLVDVRGDASNQWWNFGAALSFKPFSTHYTFHGGFSALGAGSGALCVHLASIVGSAAWYYGAALSLLHIMLIAVDLLVMDMLVVCFIFLLMELLVSLIGIVVLLYKYTLCSS